MADLQELFSRLKAAQTTDQSSSQSQAHLQSSPWAQSRSHQHSSTSSPLMSPPIYNPNPMHSSNIISPIQPSSTVGTPNPDQNRTNTLLNLLKFNTQPGQTPQSGPLANLQNIGASRGSSIPAATSIEGREANNPRQLSASDLMATLQRQSSSASVQPSPSGHTRSETQSNPQDLLLNLLTKPKSQQPQIQPIAPPEFKKPDSVDKHASDVEALTRRLAETAVKSAETQPEPTSVRQFGGPPPNVARLETPQPSTMFSYVNPFDQLHSSSPLNRASKPESKSEPLKFEILKPGRDSANSRNEHLISSIAGNHQLNGGSSTTSAPPVESETKNRSVSEALEDIGEAVDKQVEKALAAASAMVAPLPDNAAPDSATDTANLSTNGKKADAANDDVESSWESAGDEEDANKNEGRSVEVYNFPMKPFVSIQIKDMPIARPIRQDNFMVIAQLKKEFDQIDRCLVTASQTFITYAQAATKKDNGGLRIIRQDSGDHKQVFRSSGERVFSVQFCAAPGGTGDVETVLGTGVNGSVFWISLDKSRGDVFADDDVEAQGFVMPPITTAEENTSGSPVKTRARLSSRHPEFFAIARGKQIFIVSPQMARNKAYYNAASRKVDSEKFFADHSLKINTGKAGKDFCFSEDDTVIASLDKNGRFKFWDVRNLTTRLSGLTEEKHDPIELREPLWTMNAAASGSKPEEKPSVSSIMFVDKERPVAKGSALRYVIIGFKQNHILQLWDLGLGKAVQEIRLPHEKDSDGICSISYHPKTGIIAIGHPTRNSIYFIHLSAPKYTIPHMQQAQYIDMIARQDRELPKPDSTAIMSGLREFSFAKVGQLRSVDMLKTPVENASERNSAEETMFELYIMHSKGIVGISIKREDLGWDAQNKMVNPKDAKVEGFVEVLDLVQPPKLPTPSEQSSAADAVPKPVAKTAKQPAVQKMELKKEPIPEQVSNGIRGKDTVVDKVQKQTQAQNQPSAIDKPSQSTASMTTLPVTHKTVAEVPQPVRNVTDVEDRQLFQSVVEKQFQSLYQRIDSDKRVHNAADGARQEALLRLVSETLTENTERSLSTIIKTSIEKDVVPVLSDTTSKLIDNKLSELVPQHLNSSISGAIHTALPAALQQALKDKEIHRVISDTTANQVATTVQQHVSQLLHQSLPDMASQAAKKMMVDLETRTDQRLQRAALQHEQDAKKIDELTGLVKSLYGIVQNLVDGQSALHAELIKMQEEKKSQVQTQPVDIPAESLESNALAAVSSPQNEGVDAEIAHMTELLTVGRYEEATIQWISSDRQAEIFDNLFVRVDPGYLETLSPLVALTVSAAITSSFDTFLSKRLEWLSTVLAQIDVRDGEIMDVAPKIMDVISQRLQGVYIELSEVEPRNPCLKQIMTLNRAVTEIRRVGG